MERLSLPEKDKLCKLSFLHQMSVSETYPMHTHDFYEIFYVVKGRAMHCINDVSECLTAGTAQLIRPFDRHNYSFFNRYDMELISIGIEPEVMQQILEFTGIAAEEVNAGEMPPAVIYDARKAEGVAETLMKLQSIASAQKRRAYGKAVIAQLVLDMVENPLEKLRLPGWLDELVRQMAEKENFCQGLPCMLKLAPVSQNHLNREMKRYLGMTPTELINSRRIAYASGLLLENRYSITEISGLCGFEAASNFYENFRRIYGCTPKEFMKRHNINIQEK